MSELLSLNRAWHFLAIVDVAEALDVKLQQGLAPREAEKRSALYGPNRLADQPPRSRWRLFLAQFKSLLILVLIGAAALAGSIGNTKDAVVILGIVVLNAALGFYQEHRAEQSLAALKKMLALKARVRRDGRVIAISTEELAPGDLVLLEAGDRVPADGRLITAHSLEIDESALTGESQPVGKQVEPVAEPALPLAERRNMAYMNTMVTRGRAEMVVTATGMQTEMGRLANVLVAAEEGPTPLQIQLDQLGRRLGAIALALVTLLFLLELLRGQDLLHILFDSIALAVAAIPEGLPTVVTVTLALGMRRMARHRAIVKRLAGVETLGCTTVICSDKTGTLTVNQMTARAFFYRGQSFTVTGEGYAPKGDIHLEDGSTSVPDLIPFLLPLALCNDSRVRDGQVIGDPTEGALLILAAKGGVKRDTAEARWPRIAEVPFDSAHKFMATFHQDGGSVQMFVKGAPDVVVERCALWLGTQGEQPLNEALRERLIQENKTLAARGLRVLAVASRTLPAAAFDPAADLFACVQELTCAGLVGLMDPPRPEAREAIALCQQAGIAVKMITGDHKDTAAAIARELGLEGTVITGAELDRIDAHRLAESIEAVAVFARVAPEHKVKIVQALKERGHIVGMTGDGVNDAPALKSADIGVAMGRAGTEVAKEAATMVLTDDNFATIVGAVQEGRTIYDNILKFMRFQLSTTMGAMFTVFSAPLLGLPEPFNPTHILWVAMIMDGPPAIALGLDAAHPGIMQQPPRSPQAQILPLWRLSQIITLGAIMTLGTLGVLSYGMQSGALQRAVTLAFTTFVLFQVFNVLNARTEHGSAFTSHLFTNRMLWLALLGVVSLQAVAVHWSPAQAIFHTTDLFLVDWGIACGAAASILLLEAIRKFVAGRLFVGRNKT